MLSQKARYALRALLILAGRKDGDEPMMIGDIAEEGDIPRKFLEQILVELKKRGILASTRGRSGGYRLGKPAREITFAEIIRIVDGPLALAPCVSVAYYQRCLDCEDEATCVIRKALKDARDATANALEKHNLASALASGRRAKSL